MEWFGTIDVNWSVEDDVEIEITEKMKNASVFVPPDDRVYPYVLVGIGRKLYLEMESN